MRSSPPCPLAEKHAALALGATRWEMIRGAVFPHSFGGMVGAVMLGLGPGHGRDHRRRPASIGASTQITAEPVRQRRRHAGDHRANWFGEPRGPARLGADRPRRGAVRHHDHRELRGPDRRAARRDAHEGGELHDRPSTSRRDPAPVPDDLRRASRCRAAAGSPTSRGHGARSGRSLVVAVVPLGLRRRLRGHQGPPSASAGTSSPADIPAPGRQPGGGMGPAIVGTLLITGVGRGDGDPARRARRDLPQRVRQAEPAGPHHPRSWPTS